MYQVGDRVERCIEDMWFAAMVEGVTLTRKMVKLRYFDDDNVEDNVPMAEVRRIDLSESKEGAYESKGSGSEYKDNGSSSSSVRVGGKCVPKESTLLKPLYGLVEDDEAEREAEAPLH